MRIVLFNLATDVDDPSLGFTTRWIEALAKRLAFIHVITMRVGRLRVPENVRVYSVGKEKGHGKWRRALTFYRHLYRILREDRIDICFSHMAAVFTVLGAPLLKAHGIPIVTWYAHPSVTWTLKFAHHISDSMVASLATAYPYRREKLAIVGQGIDTGVFCPNGERAPAEPPMVLCVGRLSSIKDHPTLLRGIALLRQELGARFRVVILGDPASHQDERYGGLLREQIRNLGMDDIVRIEPAVPMAALPDWYRRCTVHVNLTPTGSGDKVVWEALACGRPCIVANEGFKESLGKYAGRLLFRYGDPQDLAQQLKGILALDEPGRAIIGVYLRDRVIGMHGLDGLADRLIDVFADCLQTRRREAGFKSRSPRC